VVGFVVQGLIRGGSDGSFRISIADCISKSNLVRFWEVILCFVLESKRGNDYDRIVQVPDGIR
jgi:hypothetical protein